MKFLSLILLFSLDSYAQLRVVVPQEANLSEYDLREGELVTGTDSKTLYIHANSAVEQVSNPAGVILAFGGTTAPAGYLLCDGSVVSRTTYANLFAAIGTAFGAGDGSTTFHLPDFRGRFLRGHNGAATNDPDASSRTAMNDSGNTGNNIGSIQSDAFQGHWHNLTDSGGTSYGIASNNNVGSGSSYRATNSSNLSNVRSPKTDGVNGTPRTASETRPVNAYVNYIIKY